MITAKDFKNGKTIQYEGGIWAIADAQLVESESGSAFIRTKLKNVIDGTVFEKSFRLSDAFEEAIIVRKSMQFLFRDGETFYFMDPETYQQIEVDQVVVGDALRFVKVNEECKVHSHDGMIFTVEGPMFVELLVMTTDNVEEAEDSLGKTKLAVVETGAEVLVPLFVKKGDRIKIDTRTGLYLSRV